jgi:hypothetical protein
MFVAGKTVDEARRNVLESCKKAEQNGEKCTVVFVDNSAVAPL